MEQKKCINANYVYSVKAQKKRLRKPFIISVALFSIGVAGLASYIVWGTVWDTLYGYTPAACNALLACAVPFVLGLVVMLSVRTSVKSVGKREGEEKRYEFYADCMLVYEGNAEGVKLFYDWIMRVKQRGQFLYLYCMNMTVLHIVDISVLSQKELNTVNALLRLPVPGDAEKFELENFAELKNLS